MCKLVEIKLATRSLAKKQWIGCIEIQHILLAHTLLVVPLHVVSYAPAYSQLSTDLDNRGRIRNSMTATLLEIGHAPHIALLYICANAKLDPLPGRTSHTTHRMHTSQLCMKSRPSLKQLSAKAFATMWACKYHTATVYVYTIAESDSSDEEEKN